MSHANTQVVQQYISAFNRGDIDGLCQLFTPDAEIFGVHGRVTVEVARPIWKSLMESLRCQFRVESMVAEGNVVVVRMNDSGESVGPFLGNPPTGKRYEVTVIEWFEIEAGKIRRRWAGRDSASIFRQLGFVTA